MNKREITKNYDKLITHLMNARIGIDYCLQSLDYHDPSKPAIMTDSTNIDVKEFNQCLKMLDSILEYNWGELSIPERNTHTIPF